MRDFDAFFPAAFLTATLVALGVMIFKGLMG